MQLEVDELDIAGDAELLQAPEIGGGDVAHRADDAHGRSPAGACAR